MSYCLNCFHESGEEGKCPMCGYRGDSEERLPQHLEANTLLKGRYRIGRVLGQGGFGITYKAYDCELLRIVAVKEYYPAEAAQRVQGENTVSAYLQSEQTDIFGNGKKKFVEEARTLAKFSDFPGIVRLYDCFEENNTAYIVMQFLEGIDLSAYLKGKGGRVSSEEAKQILLPVIDVLKEVHRAGIIHRDISPNNIFITASGQIKVIDFGAAREALIGREKSLSILLKPGYAPEEQYRTHGNQGPWTDVYALSATLYRMVTGLVPPDALERLSGGEELQLPGGLLPEVRFVIEKGMAIKASDRFKDMAELQEALYGERNINPENKFEKSTDNMQRNPEVKSGAPYFAGSRPGYPTGFPPVSPKKSGAAAALIAAACALIIIAMVIVTLVLLGGKDIKIGGKRSETATKETVENYLPPNFPMVTASKKTVSSNTNRAYGAALAYDGKTDTAWNVPGGPGEWIQLYADTPQQIKGIKILSGYTKYSPDYAMWIYHANSRPKDITITFSDGSHISHTLSDVFEAGNYEYQTIDFGEVKKTDFVRITIGSIYKGSKWNDCCITEIQTY